MEGVLGYFVKSMLPLVCGRYKTQGTGYRAQVTGHRLQVTGHRAQVTGYRKFNKKVTLH